MMRKKKQELQEELNWVKQNYEDLPGEDFFFSCFVLCLHVSNTVKHL